MDGDEPISGVQRPLRLRLGASARIPAGVPIPQRIAGSCAATHCTVNGIAVACVGDVCSCPIKGHHGCTIAGGSARHSINGIALAFEGDATTCGARLQAGGANLSTA